MVKEAGHNDVYSVRTSSFLDVFVHRYANEIEQRLEKFQILPPKPNENIERVLDLLQYEDDSENEKEIWTILLNQGKDDLESKFMMASCLLFQGQRFRIQCENALSNNDALEACDTKSALHLLKHVADRGFAKAQTYVALFLMSPFMLDRKNPLWILSHDDDLEKQSRVLLDKAAAQGDLLAQISIANQYLNENVCLKAVSNYIDVARVTIDEIEVSGNDKKFEPILIEDLETDTVFKADMKDQIKSIQYYKELSNSGDAEASYILGELLLYGDVMGVPINVHEAIQHFERASATIPEAHVQLGTIQLDSETGNLTLPREHFEKALDAGAVGAYTSLAFLYLEGLGVDKNETKAFEMFKHAADEEISAAYSNLAVLYLQGIGVERNVTAAVEYLKLGHEFGHVPASYNLAMGYLEGWAHQSNDDYVCEAAKILKDVAEKGQWFTHSLVGLEMSHSRFLHEGANDALRSYTVTASSGSEFAQLNAAFLLVESVTLRRLDIVSRNETLNRKIALKFLDVASTHQDSAVAKKWIAKCIMNVGWDGTCNEMNLTLARSLLLNATSKIESSTSRRKTHSEIYFLLGQIQYLGSDGSDVQINKALKSFKKCSELDSRCTYAVLLC